MDKSGISKVWRALSDHYHSISSLKVKDQFDLNPNRFSEFSLDAAGIFLDYSKNFVTAETMQLLLELAKKSNILECRDSMFKGDQLNFTEKRAVLHTALRNINDITTSEGKLVNQELKHIEKFVNDVHDGKWHGYSGKVITNVVNIGIGGSDLGPKMVVEALKHYATNTKVHFVSNLDSTNITETIKYLNPETTLFIISSKSFTTQETLTNSLTAKEWFLNKAKAEFNAFEKHFIAVTAEPELAIDFGINQNNIFPFWDWVGGRFSLWSAIGISIALAIGMDKFYEFLEGAYEMDEHFLKAPLAENMPVIFALLGIWNINFLGASTQAIIPYSEYLQFLPAYLQQLEMESNGKRVNVRGELVDYKTAPIIWGGVGTNSQHSFHQLIVQGTRLVPVDFIISLQTHNPIGNHHLLLLANCIAQSRAFMKGHTKEEIEQELKGMDIAQEDIKRLVLHKIVPGNIPNNTIVLQKLDPKSLGSLIALYEHKVFIQGAIWQINSFDQWGVQLGKKIASELLPVLQGDKNGDSLDSSTLGLINLVSSVKD